MPMYMDVHDVPGASPEDVAKAHQMDVDVQERYGVNYHHYWFNESQGKIFCVCSAPNAEAAERVHREAHGLVATKLIEIQPDLHEALMGPVNVSPAGAVMAVSDGRAVLDNPVRMVMFTDIVESTSYSQRIGDAAMMAVIEHHDDVVRALLAEFGGREVKHTGDGIMASFGSAVSAVRCAARIQEELSGVRRHPEFPWLQLRIGIAAGEPVMARNDLFGCTVQLAARLVQFAEPGESVVSSAVADLCSGKGMEFADRGEHALKGFDRPQRIFAVS